MIQVNSPQYHDAEVQWVLHSLTQHEVTGPTPVAKLSEDILIYNNINRHCIFYYGHGWWDRHFCMVGVFWIT